MYYLNQLEKVAARPRNSGLRRQPDGAQCTDLYLKHKEDHDLQFSRDEQNGAIRSTSRDSTSPAPSQESKAINGITTPCIIVSASGMVTGGRVLHHLANRLGDARNCVILGGFQAEGTRGRALQDGAKTLNLYGQTVPVERKLSRWASFPLTPAKANCCAGSRAAGDSEADLLHPRRTRSRSGPAKSHHRKISLARLRRPLPRHRSTSANPQIGFLLGTRNRAAALRFASIATCSRFFGGALVSSPRKNRRDASATSSTARANAASFAFDGLWNPLIFRTNCREAARTSSSVAAGSKLKQCFIFLHTKQLLREFHS